MDYWWILLQAAVKNVDLFQFKSKYFIFCVEIQMAQTLHFSQLIIEEPLNSSEYIELHVSVVITNDGVLSTVNIEVLSATIIPYS